LQPYICNNVSKQFLTSSTTYRRIAAAFLTALYLFISTPVSLWHKHNYSYSSKSSFNPETKTELSAGDSQSYIEEVCGICSHKFSAYSDNLPVCFKALKIGETEKKSFFSEDIIITPRSHLPNKGPPAISWFFMPPAYSINCSVIIHFS